MTSDGPSIHLRCGDDELAIYSSTIIPRRAELVTVSGRMYTYRVREVLHVPERNRVVIYLETKDG